MNTAAIRAYYTSLEIAGEQTLWVSTFGGFHWISDGRFAAKLKADDEWEVGAPRNPDNWPAKAEKFFSDLADAVPIATVRVPDFPAPTPLRERCDGCRHGRCECPCGDEHDCCLCNGSGELLFRRQDESIRIHPAVPTLGNTVVARAVALSPAVVELRVSESKEGRITWFVADEFLAAAMERIDDKKNIPGEWEVEEMMP